MAWWKSTKRQRGWVKAHEAKENGKHALRQEDIDRINERYDDVKDEVMITKGQHITLFGRCDCWKPRTPVEGRCMRCKRFI